MSVSAVAEEQARSEKMTENSQYIHHKFNRQSYA
jgi:hypothetical protein